MLLGAIRFKVSGAFLGFFLGVFIEEFLLKAEQEEDYSKSQNNATLTKMQNSFVILLANVINVNAYASQQQSYFILKYLYRRFGTPTGKSMYKKLQEKLQFSESYIEHAKFFKAYKLEFRIQVLTFCYNVCTVDKNLNPLEYELLQNFAFYMQIQQQDFVNIVQSPFKREQQKRVIHQNSNYSRNNYSILGVTESASAEELKKSYRKLVLRYHPDTTKEDKILAAKKFQEVQDAYDAIRQIKGIK